MSQNTSHAVMQQRAEAHDSLDDFPTPPWATRALLKYVIHEHASPYDVAWEPACNRLHMADPLGEYFAAVLLSDIHNYGKMAVQHDFLLPYLPPAFENTRVDWVISNPPFRLAEQFIERAGQIAQSGFAFLVRTSFLEGVGRYENLFSRNPPSIVAQFAERVPMVKGRYDPEASTATSYCWLVWIDGVDGTQLGWIPPCRRELERESDWPVKTEAA
jgi:hypothetical protein